MKGERLSVLSWPCADSLVGTPSITNRMSIQVQFGGQLPTAQLGERPIDYAHRLGDWFALRVGESHRKTHGHYLTPSVVANFMGSLCLDGQKPTVRVLDPGAGTGILTAAACEAFAAAKSPPSRIELVAYEVDVELRPVLERSFSHLSRWLGERKIELVARLEVADFVLKNAGALEGGILPYEDTFDAVICNPPYFKLPKSDPRAQACLAVVHGQPNVYGLFMAIGAALLREHGRLVFITPRSFASGSYFRRFRQWFFDRIRPTELHTFESRTEAFDEVLQETVITAGYRENWSPSSSCTVRLSSSQGAIDLERRRFRDLPIGDVLRGDCAHRVLYLPASEEHDQVRALVGSWSGSLRTYGLEVSTGPVVAFRAKALLRDMAEKKVAPLLWLQNIRPMKLTWPLDSRKAQYIDDSRYADHVMIKNRNYVVIRRFSAKEEKRRLTAAPYMARRFQKFTRVGIENHLNYIYRRGGRQLSADEAYGLAALLNSGLLDTWFRIGSGNTQVSATELRAMPLPPLEVITRIGNLLRTQGGDLDEVVNRELGYGG